MSGTEFAVLILAARGKFYTIDKITTQPNGLGGFSIHIDDMKNFE